MATNCVHIRQADGEDATTAQPFYCLRRPVYNSGGTSSNYEEWRGINYYGLHQRKTIATKLEVGVVWCGM